MIKKLVKGYAIANTLSWAFVGIGVFMDYYLYRAKQDGANPSAMECAASVYETGFIGWARFIKLTKEVITDLG